MNCDILMQCCVTKDWDSLQLNAHKVSQGLFVVKNQTNTNKCLPFLAINKREYEINQVICDLK